MKPSLLCVALLGLVIFTGAAAAGRATDEPINLNRSLVLTERQRLVFEEQVMRGSAEAALKVALFYGFVALNPIEERRWTEISAENGDPVSQYNFYHDLIESDSTFDRARAIFWLRKAASVDAEARKELDRIEHGK